MNKPLNMLRILEKAKTGRSERFAKVGMKKPENMDFLQPVDLKTFFTWKFQTGTIECLVMDIIMRSACCG
jgi:hypothetical protein